MPVGSHPAGLGTMPSIWMLQISALSQIHVTRTDWMLEQYSLASWATRKYCSITSCIRCIRKHWRTAQALARESRLPLMQANGLVLHSSWTRAISLDSLVYRRGTSEHRAKSLPRTNGSE